MQPVFDRSDPDFWLHQIFASKSAQRGAVVRRSIDWVDREIGRERFIEDVRARGFHLIRTANQFIVVCHGGQIEILF